MDIAIKELFTRQQLVALNEGTLDVGFMFFPIDDEDLLRHKVRSVKIRSCSPPLNSKNDPQHSNA